MKIKLLVVLTTLIVLRSSCYGQQIIVSSSKDDLVYAGLNNRVQIIAERIACENLIVKMTNGRIEKISNCSYNVVPDSSHYETLLTLYEKRDRDTIAIGSRYMSVEICPRLLLSLRRSNATGTNILRVTRGLGVYCADQQISYSVTQFSMTVLYADGKWKKFSVSGTNAFSEAMITAIQCLRPGDQLLFTGVRAAGGGQVYLPVEPYTYVIP